MYIFISIYLSILGSPRVFFLYCSARARNQGQASRRVRVTYRPPLPLPSRVNPNSNTHSEVQFLVWPQPHLLNGSPYHNTQQNSHSGSPFSVFFSTGSKSRTGQQTLRARRCGRRTARKLGKTSWRNG